MENGLSNRQFITLSIIIMICGIAILANDSFKLERQEAYDRIELNQTEDPSLVETEPVNTSNNATDSTSNTSGVVQGGVEESQSEPIEDTSGNVKQQKGVRYHYDGRLKIPRIGLNKGFVGVGKRGNNVDYNVAVMHGSVYPDKDNSHLVLAAHNGSGWNAFFTRIDKLKVGDIAYVEYNNTNYKYRLKQIYKDRKGDRSVNLKSNGSNKQLTLVTCARPDYKKYYWVENFEIVGEEPMQ